MFGIAFVQLVYLAYGAYLRPYREAKANVIEVVNEVYFLLLLSSLIYLNTESEWTPTLTSIYLWVLSSNSMTVFMIIIGKTSPYSV